VRAHEHERDPLVGRCVTHPRYLAHYTHAILSAPTHFTRFVHNCSTRRIASKKDTRPHILEHKHTQLRIYFHSGDAPGSGIVAKVYHPKVANFQLSPVWVAHSGTGATATQAAYVAVFTPEDKGKPARVAAYCITLPAGGAGAGSAAPMAALSVETKACATRTVFAASEARLLFSPSCNTLLVYTQSDVDTTGASYFGATGLFVMAMDGSLAEQVRPIYGVCSMTLTTSVSVRPFDMTASVSFAEFVISLSSVLFSSHVWFSH